jgi:hypothetical protein
MGDRSHVGDLEGNFPGQLRGERAREHADQCRCDLDREAVDQPERVRPRPRVERGLGGQVPGVDDLGEHRSPGRDHRRFGSRGEPQADHPRAEGFPAVVLLSLSSRER